MRLVKVHLQGYRRFLKTTTLAVGGQVTVLIGPNEAGKSSLLDAIALFGPSSSRLLAADDLHSETTDPNASFVELEFYLTSEEQRTIEIYSTLWPYTEVPRRLFLRTAVGGKRTLRLDPEPVYNPTFETNLQTLLTELQQAGARGQGGWVEMLGLLQAIPITTAAVSVSLNQRTRGPDDPIRPDLLRGLQQALNNVPDAIASTLPRPLEKYRSFLDVYRRVQELRHRPVTDLVLDALDLPVILKFTEADRNLKSETDLRQIGSQSGMANLLAWGGVDAGELLRWVEQQEDLKIFTALKRASVRLTKQLGDTWPFEPIGLTLQLKDQSLQLLIEPVGDQPFERPERRSDGLRIFLALLAFLARHRVVGGNAIVLVDELELHLHVDAQRQVVQWLEQQGQVGQILYSTHSPFALASDWTTLRAVRPDPVQRTSHVNNRIWTDRTTNQQEGLTRLLFQMGAGAAVFNAAQAILVTEGVTDIALLPRLLAESLGRPTLGVPTLPGYSEAKTTLAFEAQGARVAYLFDGDKQGLMYQRQVRKALSRAKGGKTLADVHPEDRDRVLTLEPGYDLEDYLHPGYYVQAINRLCCLNWFHSRWRAGVA